MTQLGGQYGLKRRVVKSWLWSPNDSALPNGMNAAENDATNAGRCLIVSSEVETGGLLPTLGTAGQAYAVSSRFDAHPTSPFMFDWTTGDATTGYTGYITYDFERFKPIATNAAHWGGIAEIEQHGGNTSFGFLPGFVASADVAWSHRGTPALGGTYAAPTGYSVRCIFGLGIQYTLADGTLFYANIDLNLAVTSNFPTGYPGNPRIRQVAYLPAYTFVGVDAAGWNNSVAAPIAADGVMHTVAVHWLDIAQYLATAIDPVPNAPFLPTPRDGWGSVNVRTWNLATEMFVYDFLNTAYVDLGFRNIHCDNIGAWVLGTGALGTGTIL